MVIYQSGIGYSHTFKREKFIINFYVLFKFLDIYFRI